MAALGAGVGLALAEGTGRKSAQGATFAGGTNRELDLLETVLPRKNASRNYEGNAGAGPRALTATSVQVSTPPRALRGARQLVANRTLKENGWAWVRPWTEFCARDRSEITLLALNRTVRVSDWRLVRTAVAAPRALQSGNIAGPLPAKVRGTSAVRWLY